jgi:hypothetical protein
MFHPASAGTLYLRNPTSAVIQEALDLSLFDPIHGTVS